MNLVSFSIRTKGINNFARRLWTVFSRFGFSENRIRKDLEIIVDTLQAHGAAPTFFIPAVVLRRHASLMTAIARSGAEIGVHGYVHTDFRSLSKDAQQKQTQQAIDVFQDTKIAFKGFRNPYLGWTEDAIHIFADLGFAYESNEAVFHDVIDFDSLTPIIKQGYEKSLKLYQAQPCNFYSLRPHFEDGLLRIPTSIPDDEMLFDRLRITDAKEVGRLWSQVMQNVYNYGGTYALNLHPERGVLCKQALTILLETASKQQLPVWMARLDDIALWWKERSTFRLTVSRQDADRWLVQAECTPRATVLARHASVEDQEATAWHGADSRVSGQRFIVRAAQAPCIGLSPETSQDVLTFLQEQGYAALTIPVEDAANYTLYLDMPDGLGITREEQFKRRSALVQRIEDLDTPLVHFGNWPDGSRAALAVSGDIDSITVQDFFLRILEVSKHI